MDDDDDLDDIEELSDDDLISMVKETLGDDIKSLDEQISPDEESLSNKVNDGIEEQNIINDDTIDNMDVDIEKIDGDILNVKDKQNIPKLKIPSFLLNLSPNSSNILVSILVVMIVLIIIGSIFIIRYIRAGQQLQDEIFNMDSTIVIEEFINGPNNANFIFISETRHIENHTFTLSSMLIDQTVTEFNFNDNINWGLFTVQLFDNNGKNYSLNNSFYVDNNINTTVSFEPLDRGIRGIVLTIIENSTGEEVEFVIRFDTMISVPTVAYLNDRITLNIEDGITVNLEGGVFSSAGSTLYYTIHSNPNENVYFSDISIMQGGQNLFKERHLIYNVENEDYTIARVDFAPVRNIDGNINVRFLDVFRAIKMNLEVPLQNLFRNTPNDQIRIPVGSNTLVLERIGRVRDNYILVFHGFNEGGQRIKTRLNATLKFENSEGNEVILQGNTLSADVGSDMRFDINQLGENDIPGALSTFVLDIEEVLFIEEDLTIPISLSSLPYASSPASNRVINQGKNILINEGYTNPEIVTYMVDSYRFTGVYTVRNGNDISEYILKATRQGLEWDFNIELLQ